MEFGMWGRSRVKRIGIVATRLAGTDGVSLESDKWVQVMEERRLTCYYFAGELDRPPERSYLAEEAHFNHPEIQEIQQACFGVTTRPRSLTKKIQEIKSKLKDDLYKAIQDRFADAGEFPHHPDEYSSGPCYHRGYCGNGNARNSTPSRFLLGAGQV